MMKLTVKELRGLAKDNGLKGYSALKKAELVELLVAHNVVLDNTVEDVHNEDLINDDYTNEIAISKDMSDEELAEYLGLDDSDEEEGFYDERLGIHVTPDMIGDDEDEEYINNELAVTQDIPVNHRTYAEIMADRFEEELDVPANRLELKAEKDKSYNDISKKITADNKNNNRIVSGGQAKFLQDLYLTYNINIKDDIRTAKVASEKINAINTALAQNKLNKRKCTVLAKNRPTKAQLQLIISKQGYINIMSCPKTKSEASKLISNLNKKEFLTKKQVEKEVAVTSVNEKVKTLTKCKNSDRGGFKDAVKKFFSRLFN